MGDIGLSFFRLLERRFCAFNNLSAALELFAFVASLLIIVWHVLLIVEVAIV